MEDNIKELKKKVEVLQQQNKEKVKGLANFGRGVNADYFLQLKLDTLIEMFLDEKQQLEYVLELETRLQQSLNAALSQVRMETLQKPSQSLLLPK